MDEYAVIRCEQVWAVLEPSCAALIPLRHLSHSSSALVLPLSVIFGIQLFFQLAAAPNNVENEIIWSIVGGPFPMRVRCVSDKGCLLSNHWRNGTAHGCVRLDKGKDTVTLVDYHSRPALGLSILAMPGNEFEAVAEVMSETYMPQMAGADADGTALFWSEVLAGSVMYAHVITRNTTLQGSGYHLIQLLPVFVASLDSRQASARCSWVASSIETWHGICLQGVSARVVRVAADYRLARHPAGVDRLYPCCRMVGRASGAGVVHS